MFPGKAKREKARIIGGRKLAAACRGCWDTEIACMGAWLCCCECLVKEGFIVRWTSRVNVGEVGELI